MKISLTRSLTVSAALVVFYALRLQVRPESQSGARLIIVTAFALTGFLLSSCVIIARPKTNWQWPNIFLLNIMLTVLTAFLYRCGCARCKRHWRARFSPALEIILQTIRAL